MLTGSQKQMPLPRQRKGSLRHRQVNMLPAVQRRTEVPLMPRRREGQEGLARVRVPLR
jgi:hypothetical protein